MVDSYKFCCERADAAAAAARSARLENVRERELRAEKTWRGLANKANAIAIHRAAEEREKAERRSKEED